MKTRSEMLKWAEHYDVEKYPPHLYDELVVAAKEHTEKFVLMGAWKTGSIKAKDDHIVYSDNSGRGYSFTKRWANHAPVGKTTWEYIAQNISTLKKQVPDSFPEAEPAIVQHLVGRKGFGYIWALFTLHCMHPRVYPLYDQHVYRAFRYEVSNGAENPELAVNTWAAYTEYAKYFIGLVQQHQVDFQIADRAVWTYGKWLKKQTKNMKNKPSKIEDDKIQLDTMTDDWVHSFTLGGKAKSFWWQVDAHHNIHFRRNSKEEKTETIAVADVDRIVAYVQQNAWVKLANSVSNLGNGTEKEGVGKFMYEQIKKDTAFAQLSSHLCALLTESGIFIHNGRKRGMEFRFTDDVNWKEALQSFFVSNVNDSE